VDRTIDGWIYGWGAPDSKGGNGGRKTNVEKMGEKGNTSGNRCQDGKELERK
jgi:hypothetical protein